MGVKLFKAVAKSEAGKKCLLTLGGLAVAALVVPLVLPKTGNIITFVELIICVMITINSNKFASLISLAQMEMEEAQEEQQSTKKGYKPRD